MCGVAVVLRGVQEWECGCRGCVVVCGGVLGWLCSCAGLCSGVAVPSQAVPPHCECTPRTMAGCSHDGRLFLWWEAACTQVPVSLHWVLAAWGPSG